jgi:hypothetical protein
MDEIKRLATETGNPATDNHVFPVVKRALIVKFQSRHDDAVASSHRLSEHIGKVSATHSLSPHNVGCVIHMLQHVNVAKWNTKPHDISKVSQCHSPLANPLSLLKSDHQLGDFLSGGWDSFCGEHACWQAQASLLP